MLADPPGVTTDHTYIFKSLYLNVNFNIFKPKISVRSSALTNLFLWISLPSVAAPRELVVANIRYEPNIRGTENLEVIFFKEFL